MNSIETLSNSQIHPVIEAIQDAETTDHLLRVAQIGHLPQVLSGGNISLELARAEAVDQCAVFCQKVGEIVPVDKLKTEPEISDARLEAYSWLFQTLRPITKAIISRYHANERFDRSDLEQTAYCHAIKELVPKYDPAQGGFKPFYRTSIWRRIHQYIAVNYSHFTTSVESYRSHQADNPDVVNARESLSLESAIDNKRRFNIKDVDPVMRQVLIREQSSGIIEFINGLSTLEKTVFIEVAINGRSYIDVAEELGVEFKNIDNALQRAYKKLKTKHIND